MVFKASLDTMAKVITIGITVIFACLILLPVVVASARYDERLYIAIIVFAVYAIAWLFSPQQYGVTTDALEIYRPIGKIVIPKSDIATAQLQNAAPMAVRTFGVGGLFGYFGAFYNFQSGNMSYYITNRHNCIMIITNNNRKIVISPDEREAFIDALQQ